MSGRYVDRALTALTNHNLARGAFRSDGPGTSTWHAAVLSGPGLTRVVTDSGGPESVTSGA